MNSRTFNQKETVDTPFLISKLDEITSLCMKKCIQKYENPSLPTSHKVCLGRCAAKFTDTMEFSNKAFDFYVAEINEKLGFKK